LIIYEVEICSEQRYSRQDTEEVYLRVGDETKKLTYEQIMNLDYDKGLRSFEDQICSDFDPSDLNIELLESYMKSHGFE